MTTPEFETGMKCFGFPLYESLSYTYYNIILTSYKTVLHQIIVGNKWILYNYIEY